MSVNSFVTKCPECGEDTCLNNVSTRPVYHSKECWSCGWFDSDQEDYEGCGYMNEEERLELKEHMEQVIEK